MTDKPVPQPGPKDVLVRVSAVSLNYRDKLLVEGFYNPRMPFPMIQVADAVGEIVDGGKNVTRFKTGERVIAQYATRWIDGEPQGDESAYLLGSTIPGALAEYLVLDQEALVHAPGYLSDEEAAAISCAGITAWYSLVERGGLKANQTVLIQGTGGVSLFGLQIGSALGARVIVTSSSDEKLARVTELGAWQGINYRRTLEWEKEVLRLTSEKGVDQILEVAGGKSLAQSITAVNAGGTISVIRILDGVSSEVPIFPLLIKQAVLRGISVGPRRALEDMIRAFDSFKLWPVIDAVSFIRRHIGRVRTSVPRRIWQNRRPRQGMMLSPSQVARVVELGL